MICLLPLCADSRVVNAFAFAWLLPFFLPWLLSSILAVFGLGFCLGLPWLLLWLLPWLLLLLWPWFCLQGLAFAFGFSLAFAWLCRQILLNLPWVLPCVLPWVLPLFPLGFGYDLPWL